MKKIIILGSIKTIIEKEKNALARSDFKIFTTTSSTEALKIHRNEKADLIISELEMFDIPGDELCSIIRSDNDLKDVAVFLICYMKEASIRRCKACGANAYLTKPIDYEELSGKVSKLLNAPARRGMRVLTNITVNGKTGGGAFYAKSENISSTGMLLKTERDLEKGDKVTCSFFIDSKQVIIDGEVVRTVIAEDNMNRYGIKFLNVAPDKKQLIDEFIKGKLKDK